MSWFSLESEGEHRGFAILPNDVASKPMICLRSFDHHMRILSSTMIDHFLATCRAYILPSKRAQACQAYQRLLLLSMDQIVEGAWGLGSNAAGGVAGAAYVNEVSAV